MRKNENGRSMVEMLGVLAIIGVLSVGGIYGYTSAMQKYKANEIIQTASMLATLAQAADGGNGGKVCLNEITNQTPGGVALTAATTCADTPAVVGTGANASTIKMSAVTIAGAGTPLCDVITALAPAEPTDTDFNTQAKKDASAAARAGYYIKTCS